jgi:DNA-binding Xre family transcriptional regulator
MNKAAQKGLSQTELAKAMAMAPQQLSALLRAPNCGLRTIARLAEALNTTPAELLAGRD